jgi:glutathione S-transferase
MADLVIYGTPVSPFVRKVEAVLRSQGVAYDFEDINIMNMPDWFVEISPARRIPVLRDRSVGDKGVSGTIADSSAICLYLGHKLDAGLYGEAAFDAGCVAALEE